MLPSGPIQAFPWPACRAEVAATTPLPLFPAVPVPATVLIMGTAEQDAGRLVKVGVGEAVGLGLKLGLRLGVAVGVVLRVAVRVAVGLALGLLLGVPVGAG